MALGDQDKNELAQAQRAKATGDLVKRMQEELPMRIQLLNAVAADRKLQYDAYLKAGFNPEQAMQLLCAEIKRMS